MIDIEHLFSVLKTILLDPKNIGVELKIQTENGGLIKLADGKPIKDDLDGDQDEI